MPRLAQIGSFACGDDQPLLLIAGPCVLEEEALACRIAGELCRATADQPVNLIFKASFDKANRTSAEAFRGPGLARGLEMLDRVRTEFQLPVTTDIHEPRQASAVAEVCELLQVPAFLSRQTDLLQAAAATGRAVNVKKGQFMAPGDMRHVLNKLSAGGCDDMMLCERGTFFGYGRLVNDMQSIPLMQQLGVPVIFDATHSVQEPGSLEGATGGKRDMIEPLSRAAVAIGADGIFLETHPDPSMSPSDGSNMVPLAEVGPLLHRLLQIRRAVQELSCGSTHD